MNRSEIKLKHLELFATEEVDYSKIMREVLSYPDRGIKKYIRFRSYFKKAFELNKEISQIDILELELPEQTPIVIPKSVDNISFKARMELEVAIGKLDQGNLSERIAEVIAIACFKDNNKVEFDLDSIFFKGFKYIIINEPLSDMVGIFNWIKKQLIISNTRWDNLFRDVDSTDPDFISAGGNLMQRFNVVSTIEDICKSFGLSYDEAWNLSYVVVQMKSLKDASRGLIQKKMTDIKEKRMKQNRGGSQ